MPDVASSKLVEVAALSHQDVTDFQRVPIDLVALNQDGLYLRKIQMPVLDVRNPEIGKFDGIFEISPPFSKAGSDFSNFM